MSITLVIKWLTIKFNPDIEYLRKAMDFYLLIKLWAKIMWKIGLKNSWLC